MKKINKNFDENAFRNALTSISYGKTGTIYFHEYEEGVSSFSVLYIPEWLTVSDYLDGDEYYRKKSFVDFYECENLPDEYIDLCIDYANNPINMKIVTLWEHDGETDFELTIDYEVHGDYKITHLVKEDFEKFKKLEEENM